MNLSALFYSFKMRFYPAEIYMWEDDYGQIEFMPAANYSFVLQQALDVSQFALEHYQGENKGFSAVCQIEDYPYSIDILHIPIIQLEQQLSTHKFQRIKRIYYPEGPSFVSYKAGKTRAYGTADFAIWVDVSENKVNKMWLTYSSQVTHHTNQIETQLHYLGTHFDLILADWNSCDVVQLKDENQVKHYVSSVINN